MEGVQAMKAAREHDAPQHNDLPQAWKAAAILNVLDSETLERLAQHFTPEDFARIRALQVDPAAMKSLELSAIVEDFAESFVRRLRSIGDVRPPAALLEEVLAPEDLQRLTEVEEATPVWEDERFASVPVLGQLAAAEHPQVVAFIFSRIDTDLCAQVLQTLQAELRNDILLRLLNMRPVAEGMVVFIEQQIRVAFIDNAAGNRSEEARARIAGIVNRMEREEAERFLELLKQARPDEAKEIARMLFSFEDIAKLSEKDRAVLFDRAPTEITVKALFGADQGLVELALAALGGRMRKMVEAELSSGNAPAEEEVREARRQIAALALQLASDGEIVIDTGDE